MTQYIALIHKDEGTDYGVSFPDFPGCITAGTTLDEARRNAIDVLAFHIGGMVEDGDPIPLPSTLEAIMADSENRDGVAILVDAPMQTPKSVRINVSVPEDVLERIDDYAGRAGYTRSGFLTRAAIREIERQSGGNQ